MSLAHPNIVTSYKTCVVRVLEEGEAGEEERSGGASAGPSSGGSAARTGASYSSGSSGGRVVHSLTDRNALVQVMPSTATLEPGCARRLLWLRLRQGRQRVRRATCPAAP